MAVNYKDSEKESDPDVQILKDSREGLQTCIEDEQELRSKMLDDQRFASLDQWPEDVRASRENDSVNGPRPCLTIDQINQYTTQVSNDLAANRPAVKVRPENEEASIETAKIFDGLIRKVEYRSNAKIAYHTAADSAVNIGLGFFRIVADYLEGSFDQELLIKRIPDTFSVYLSSHLMPDGSDAEKGWIMEKVPVETFKRDYPKAKVQDEDFKDLGMVPTWKSDTEVIVCEYFYKKYTKVPLVYLEDGRTMTRADYETIHDGIPEEAKPKITGDRDYQKVSIGWCKHSGCEVLDKRELPGKYIPIVEVVGKEKIVEGRRQLWGLVRPAKDSLRAFNYWISALTEKMALAPKAPFVGAVGQFATMGEKWDKANVNNYAKLEYDAIDVNGNVVAAPRRQEPMQMEPAMAQMLQIMQNNVKSSLGMYKASVGDTQGGDQSGRAILALKKESDTGTSHFGENQAISIEHCGRILVDLFPHYVDTKQIVQILGEDGKTEVVSIDPDQEEAVREFRDPTGKIRRIYNLNKGKYGVAVTVGPGYSTSRQEAATVMTELANSAKDPISAAIMRYGAVKNSDFHGSEEIMKMLKAMLPPQLQQTEGQDLPPEAMAAIGQLKQAGQQLQLQLQEVSQENQQLKAGVVQAQEKIRADHEAKMAQLKMDEAIEMEKARLARIKAERDFQLEQWKVEQQIELKQMELLCAQDCNIDGALSKVSNMSDQFLMKTSGLVDKTSNQEEGGNGGDVAQLQKDVMQLQKDFLDGVAQIVAALQSKKKITMTLPSGGKASAEVQSATVN